MESHVGDVACSCKQRVTKTCALSLCPGEVLGSSLHFITSLFLWNTPGWLSSNITLILNPLLVLGIYSNQYKYLINMDDNRFWIYAYFYYFPNICSPFIKVRLPKGFQFQSKESRAMMYRNAEGAGVAGEMMRTYAMARASCESLAMAWCRNHCCKKWIESSSQWTDSACWVRKTSLP